MSIKYVVNVTILNLLLASATCSSERRFTPANPPRRRLVSTRRRSRMELQTGNAGAGGNAHAFCPPLHPSTDSTRWQSQQHQLRCSLDLFRTGQEENGDELVRAGGGGEETPPTRPGQLRAPVARISGFSWSGSRGRHLRGRSLARHSYQLRREVLPRVMK